jgi:hypothetical protein
VDTRLLEWIGEEVYDLGGRLQVTRISRALSDGETESP